jgi:3-hydroxybutyryl-CoA dehydrogenase
MSDSANTLEHGATLPTNLATRPITIIGAGTLGRRIALMMSTQGGEVRLYDTNEAPRNAGVAFVEAGLPDLLPKVPDGRAGKVTGYDDLEAALKDAWLIIESVPEIPELKRKVLGNLDALAPADAIITSNSSSFPSSELIQEVKHPERVLTSHFYMPPRVLPVELMSCGKTDPAVIDLLMEQFAKYGVIPFRVQKESVGLIFNRVWAAIKREALYVVAQGVSTPKDLDGIYNLILGAEVGPFRTMDQVGLDVVLAIEEHYAALRPGTPQEPRDLLKDYIAKGWLGIKSGRGFYDDYDKSKPTHS